MQLLASVVSADYDTHPPRIVSLFMLAITYIHYIYMQALHTPYINCFGHGGSILIISQHWKWTFNALGFMLFAFFCIASLPVDEYSFTSGGHLISK